MTKNRDDKTTAAAGVLTAFERLVDTYGSDPARWPFERRGPAEALLRSSSLEGANARRRLAEARALDRVLAVAMPVDAAKVANLANRIVHSSRQGVRPARPVLIAQQRLDRSRASSRVSRTGWAAGALLAASLLLGISIAPAVSPLPAFHEVADLVGLGHLGDQLALSAGEDGGLQDEDVL